MLFTGQSNEESHGTLTSTYNYPAIPGGSGAAGINATAFCYETMSTPSGATPGSGTLTCSAPTSGTIYAGEVITSGGTTGQVVSSAYNRGNFPAVTGTGTNNGGTYVVTNPAVIGSISKPVAMTFAEPDIGGSGTLNPRCQIWTPLSKGGMWETYDPKVNSNPQAGTAQGATFGPEGAICQHWTQDNPGQTLYMIKAAIGGSHLCDEPAGQNDLSPEYGGTGAASSVYTLLHTETAAAEAALFTQFGITNYAVKMIQYGQGEQDSQDICGFPSLPFSSNITPNAYLVNLQDLINRFAIPAPISASFTGYITGQVLTVTSVTSGTVHQYQLLKGAGIDAGTYIGSQLTGVTGGAGTYALQVYQAVARKKITNNRGVACDRASINGQFFFAEPDAYSGAGITKSCVTGGVFAVGDVLSEPGLLPGTVITGLDSKGDTKDGEYEINVLQTVASNTVPEPMSASVYGWGTGSDSAKFVLFRTFLPKNSVSTGVQLAQQFVNDNLSTALTAVTINTNDAFKATPTEIHYHASWIAELGRRLYEGYLGTCDYHSPTC
jgi:hypothetical protein